MKKRYILDIEYDPDTEEIESLSEGIEEDKISIAMGGIDLCDYFDETMQGLVDLIYEVGEA